MVQENISPVKYYKKRAFPVRRSNDSWAKRYEPVWAMVHKLLRHGSNVMTRYTLERDDREWMKGLLYHRKPRSRTP